MKALTDAAADDGVLAIVLTGSGRAYSSGVDLDALRGGDSGTFQTEFVPLVDALIDCPEPLLAAVHGPAVGFGATMLLHCDVVIVARDARIRFPFTQLGTAPAAASSVLLPAAIGAQRAAKILFDVALGERRRASGDRSRRDRRSGRRGARHGARDRDHHHRATPATVAATKRLLRLGAADARAAIERESAAARALGPI